MTLSTAQPEFRRSAISALSCAVAIVFFASAFAVSVPAAPVRIAENDGSISFSSSTYTSGLNTLGDANFVSANLASCDSLGSDAIIKLTMGRFINGGRFRAANGAGAVLLGIKTGKGSPFLNQIGILVAGKRSALILVAETGK